MNILRKADGGISKINVLNLLALLFALFEIFKPFLPVEYLPIAVAILAAVNVILRTFFTDQPIPQG